VPRDRAGSFEPQLIAKGQTRFDGFDDKILSLYARGMTVRLTPSKPTPIPTGRVLESLNHELIFPVDFRRSASPRLSL
jgi:hypothetical protein